MGNGLLNWPPSKGPKPDHLEIVKRYLDFEPPARTLVPVRPSRVDITERKILLEAIGHAVTKEPGGLKVHKPLAPFPKGSGIAFKRIQIQAGIIRYEKHFKLNTHIQTLAGLDAFYAREMIRGLGLKSGDLEFRLEPKTFSVTITYPLTVGVRLKIKPYDYVREYADGNEEVRREMSIGYLLWIVAKEYERIYEDHQQYKVWGHAFEDLWFDGLNIVKNEARISVAS